MITQNEANYRNASWFVPKQSIDPSLRKLIYGPVRPMDRPGFLARLFHIN